MNWFSSSIHYHPFLTSNCHVQYGHGILVCVYRPSATQEQSLVTHDNLPMVVGVCMYHSFMDKGKARLDGFLITHVDTVLPVCFSDNFLYKLNILFHNAECRKQVL